MMHRMQDMLRKMAATVPPPRNILVTFSQQACTVAAIHSNCIAFSAPGHAADKAADSEIKRLLERMVATVPPIFGIFFNRETLELCLH